MLVSNIKQYYSKSSLAFAVTAWVVLFVVSFVIAYIHPIPSRIQIGGITFFTYGLIMAAAILVGWWYTDHFLDELERVQLIRLLPVVLVVCIIGARLYHVAINFVYYSGHWGQVFAIWQGGLSIWGILISLLIVLWIYKPTPRILSAFAMALPLGQAIGRLGNVANSEILGRPTISLIGVSAKALDQRFLPWFLFEQVTLLMIFIVIHLAFIRKGVSGRRLFLLYILLYCIARIILEGLRMPQEQIMGISVSYFMAGILGLISVIVFWRLRYDPE